LSKEERERVKERAGLDVGLEGKKGPTKRVDQERKK
jgi:hypothetical protein